MAIVAAGGAQCLHPQTEATTDGDETIETTTTEAHDAARMIAKAPAETAHAAGPPAAHLGDTATEGTETGTVVNEGNDLRVL